MAARKVSQLYVESMKLRYEGLVPRVPVVTAREDVMSLKSGVNWTGLEAVSVVELSSMESVAGHPRRENDCESKPSWTRSEVCPGHGAETVTI